MYLQFKRVVGGLGFTWCPKFYRNKYIYLNTGVLKNGLRIPSPTSTTIARFLSSKVFHTYDKIVILKCSHAYGTPPYEKMLYLTRCPISPTCPHLWQDFISRRCPHLWQDSLSEGVHTHVWKSSDKTHCFWSVLWNLSTAYLYCCLGHMGGRTPVPPANSTSKKSTEYTTRMPAPIGRLQEHEKDTAKGNVVSLPLSLGL